MLGNYTSQQTAAGCSVTSCNYGGFVNGSIVTRWYNYNAQVFGARNVYTPWCFTCLGPKRKHFFYEATEKYKRLLLLFHVIFCG
ncbi:hypothetical protein B296_00023182 [Ensete ventricosum]|uniref:Uncharacterized protein n=1 Tax=Ensete ventricosum TaxID=4639 RepID=A0A427AWU8_ENSVE|nr:hypothetical protein B296_00023182 [Ensete ventricosum]